MISSFFISNEKNSSLTTKLLSNSRAIFVAVALHILDKKKNKLNVTIMLGLVLAVLGSVLINIESLLKNISTQKEEEKNKNIGKMDEAVKIKINN